MTDSPRPRFPWPQPEPVRLSADGPSAQWEDSALPKKQEWRDTFEDLFNGAGSATYLERAERLAGYGFVPQDLRRVCSNPRVVAAFPDPEVSTERDAEALAALAHEAAIYYSNGYTMSRDLELGYARRLISLGWLQPQVASLLGSRCRGSRHC